MMKKLNALKRSKKNIRTVKKKKKQHVNLFQSYISATKGDNTEIHLLKPEVLDKYLEAFFLGVRKQDSTEYEPTYLKNIQCSLERHLRNNKYSHSIIEDFMFDSSREALRAKQRDLKKSKC